MASIDLDDGLDEPPESTASFSNITIRICILLTMNGTLEWLQMSVGVAFYLSSMAPHQNNRGGWGLANLEVKHPCLKIQPCLPFNLQNFWSLFGQGHHPAAIRNYPQSSWPLTTVIHCTGGHDNKRQSWVPHHGGITSAGSSCHQSHPRPWFGLGARRGRCP